MARKAEKEQRVQQGKVKKVGLVSTSAMIKKQCFGS